MQEAECKGQTVDACIPRSLTRSTIESQNVVITDHLADYSCNIIEEKQFYEKKVLLYICHSILDIVKYRNIKSADRSFMATFSNIIGDMTRTSAAYYK